MKFNISRKKLVVVEIILSISIVIGILFLIINPYFILKGWFKEVLYINDDNRLIVENLVKKSKYYGDEHYKYLEDFSDVKKIQFFLAFNDFEFTFYYKDGTTKEITDDDLSDLKKYIENNGYAKSEVLIVVGVGVIILCIILNEIRKNISNKIDLIDKQEE